MASSKSELKKLAKKVVQNLSPLEKNAVSILFDHSATRTGYRSLNEEYFLDLFELEVGAKKTIYSLMLSLVGKGVFSRNRSTKKGEQIFKVKLTEFGVAVATILQG